MHPTIFIFGSKFGFASQLSFRIGGGGVVSVSISVRNMNMAIICGDDGSHGIHKGRVIWLRLIIVVVSARQLWYLLLLRGRIL